MSALDEIRSADHAKTVLKVQEARKRELRALIDACNAMKRMTETAAGQVFSLSEEEMKLQDGLRREMDRVRLQMAKALREAEDDTKLT